MEGRYLGFLGSLDQSKKPFLRLLYRSCCYDQSSVTGRNIDMLLTAFQKYDVASLISSRNSLKRRRRYELAADEMWKIDVIKDIGLYKGGHIALDIEEEDAQEMLAYVCTS